MTAPAQHLPLALIITERIPIPCGCGCGLPAAHVVVVGGRLALEIRSRHRGEQHVTVLQLAALGDMIYTQDRTST